MTVPSDVTTDGPSPSLPLPVQNPSRRRSSIIGQIGTLADAGGVNSPRNFARSWTRAAKFYSQRKNDDTLEAVFSDQPRTPPLDVPQSFSPQSGSVISSFGPGPPSPQASSNPEISSEGVVSRLRQRQEVLVQRKSFPASGTNGSSVFDRSRHDSADAKTSLLQQHSHEAYPSAIDTANEETPLLSKPVEDDLRKATTRGESTFPQTTFNMINVLIGMSMLAVPYGIRLSGWVVGITSFTFAALVTSYTGTLLARAVEVDPSGALGTYDDLAFVAYGRVARTVVRVLFNLELVAVAVALILLGADCAHSLVPSLDMTVWKLLCGVIVTPLCALPMRILSFTSLLGIASSVSIITIVFAAGLSKPDRGGSLRSPASTSLWPDDWSQVPKAFGMLMACYGAHSMFPNFIHDMRKPAKFDRAIFISYGFAWFIQIALGTVGYLMFGQGVRDEVTINVFETHGYAAAIPTMIITAMAILPLTKIPLNTRPIITTIFTIFRIHAPAPQNTIDCCTDKPTLSTRHRIFRSLTYLFTPFLLVGIAVLVPSFDQVISVLGNLLCCLISVIFPCLFHLRLYGATMPLWQKILEWALVVIFAIPAFGGTIYSLLPGR